MNRRALCLLTTFAVLFVAGCASSGSSGITTSSDPRSTPDRDSARLGVGSPDRTSGDRASDSVSDLRAAYVDGDYDTVVRLAEDLHRDSLRSSTALHVHMLLGRAEQARGQDEAAVEALRAARVAAVEAGESVVHVDRALGESAAALYRWPQAASAFRRVLDAQPDDRAARLALAEVYRQSRNWRQAQQQYTRLVRADSSNGTWWARLAKCNLELGRQDAAVRHFAQAHQELPQAADVALSLSRLYRATKQPVAARAVVDTTLSYQKGDPRLWRRKADLAFEQDDLGISQKAYRQTLAMGDSSATVFRRLGLIEVKRKNYAQALSPLEQSLRRNQLHPRTTLYLGISYLKVDSLARATSLLQRAIDQAARGPITKAFRHLGAANNRQRNVEAAVRAYRTVLRLRPAQTEVYFRLATVYDEHYREKATAARYYRRFLREADSTQTQLRTYAEDRLNALRSALHMEKGVSESGG